MAGFTLIEDQVLGSAAASITFNTGLTDYTKFRLTVYVVNDGSAKIPNVRFNADSGTNYAYQYLDVTSTSVGSARSTGQTVIPLAVSSTAANSTSMFTFEVSKPLATTPARTTSNSAVMSGGGPVILMDILAGEWNNTSDLISSIAVLASAGNFDTGTRAVLEGAA